MAGLGTYTYNSGAEYAGEWVTDLRDGYGIYTKSDGSKYIGEWMSDKKHG